MRSWYLQLLFDPGMAHMHVRLSRHYNDVKHTKQEIYVHVLASRFYWCKAKTNNRYTYTTTDPGENPDRISPPSLSVQIPASLPGSYCCWLEHQWMMVCFRNLSQQLVMERKKTTFLFIISLVDIPSQYMRV